MHLFKILSKNDIKDNLYTGIVAKIVGLLLKYWKINGNAPLYSSPAWEINTKFTFSIKLILFLYIDKSNF